VIITVKLALALICLPDQCHHALVGKNTVPGRYRLQRRYVTSPGYGGDVLAYRETPSWVMAIHRVWTLKPSQRREERLASDDPRDRQSITDGCINVSPEVYDQISPDAELIIE
jgi:hypothetical protein